MLYYNFYILASELRISIPEQFIQQRKTTSKRYFQPLLRSKRRKWCKFQSLETTISGSTLFQFYSQALTALRKRQRTGNGKTRTFPTGYNACANKKSKYKMLYGYTEEILSYYYFKFSGFYAKCTQMHVVNRNVASQTERLQVLYG